MKKIILLLKNMALQEEFKTQGDYLFRHRSYLPIIILVVGMAVFAYSEFHKTEIPATWFSRSYDYICLFVSLFGLYIRVITVGYTPEKTSGRNTKAGQVAEELNSSGIYSRVRHPLYLGNFFMWLGVAMLTQNTWFIIAFVFFYVVYYERIMYAEEAFLRNKFGQTYLEWAEKTPAIIPSFKNHVKAKYPFSIRKVLVKEKNGLWAVFLLFWIFNLTGDFISSRSFGLSLSFWFYGAVISTLIYLVLKVIKRGGLFKRRH